MKIAILIFLFFFLIKVQCQRYTKLYSTANEIHAAAKETVALAEDRFMSHQHEWNFDEAWQDTLSHATIKVSESNIILNRVLDYRRRRKKMGHSLLQSSFISLYHQKKFDKNQNQLDQKKK